MNVCLFECLLEFAVVLTLAKCVDHNLLDLKLAAAVGRYITEQLFLCSCGVYSCCTHLCLQICFNHIFMYLQDVNSVNQGIHLSLIF